MKRTLMASLVAWKNKSDRMPLLLYGARQVGKTWLIKEFGTKYFEDTLYINFEIDT
ncbi:MAG TPA: ATPase, partial [Spirochaetaceae bacterium]|nr:ATPase [Spirochaetaceae bacterium]